MRPDITEAEFHAYETVRLSGVTNMYARGAVMDLSGLDDEVVQAIQGADYAALKKKYGVPSRIEEAAEQLRADYATT